jgi:hypothetical protein
MNKGKPLGHKSYGHIAHLPGSRMGPADHKCPEGQAAIATIKTRDKHDRVYVQEKLDGSNVGIAMINDTIVPLTRSGYTAKSSPYEMHHRFHDWVFQNAYRFREILSEGERLCGEWLYQAHGTRYKLPHEPFVAFDIMHGQERMPYPEFCVRINGRFATPKQLNGDGPLSIADAMVRLGEFGHHGAIDPVEGIVWRVERHKQVGKDGSERKWVVDFLVKYVRPDKKDGCFLPKENEGATVLNEWASL